MGVPGRSGPEAVSPDASQVSGRPVPPAEEGQLLEELRRGEERAFATLLNRYHASLIRLARIYVRSSAVAEEVVQETWVGVLRGINQFEGQSSLKTWIFRILINRAHTRAERESRSIPFSALFDPAADPGEPAVSPERFLAAGHPQWPGHWSSPPQDWGRSPEELLLSKEVRGRIKKAIEALPPSQREVVTLRDMEQWSSEEVCNALGISETNQRVLLHRARSKVRQALEDYFTGLPRGSR